MSVAKFAVTARAIDMLGRQQVAGIPTAIHELFKNAHDADARRVEVDYWRRDPLLLLRDDGVGMSHDDFVDRWLTVGTDSKLEGGSTTAPPRRAPAAARPVLGEKGIGRLAIATIGPLVLVLTKPRPEDSDEEITAALVHWGIFEVPGVPIDRVDIPIESLPPGELPSRTVLALLREAVLANAAAIAADYPFRHLESLRSDISAFDLDLAELYAESNELRLDHPDASGTHFVIRPTERIIESDIDDQTEIAASPLRKTLLGFSNTMIPGARPPPVVVAFRDHRRDGTTDNVIGGRNFFSPDEFEHADHRIEGKFDEYGTFRGKVVVYGQEPVPYHVPWPEAAGHPTECGPFDLAFAYIQGRAAESRVDPEEHGRILAKLNQIGGLYLYRDGVRLLPYGNSDYDFLDIERRRTKNAGWHFFSYRRMFGAIETSRERNPGLIEKAGREGFKENRAYRQFKRMLEHLLGQLTADFFRDGGTYADVWATISQDLSRSEEVRKRREKQAREGRLKLARDLDRVFARIETNEPVREAEQVRREIQERLRVAASDPDREQAATEILRVEADARTKIATLQKQVSITRPPGIGLSKPLQRDWALYRERANRLEREVYMPLAVAVDRMVGDIASEANIPLDRRRRVVDAVGESVTQARKSVNGESRQVLAVGAEASRAVATMAREAVQRMEGILRDVEVELSATHVTELNDDALTDLRDRLVGRIEEAVGFETKALLALRDRLSAAAHFTSAEDVTADEVTEVLEEEVEALREEVALNLDLAQIGMALGIVQHEFQSTVHDVRASIRSLGPWANANPSFASIYRNLRTSFEHLDAYLTLFTPLDRRLYRTSTVLAGEQILGFLRNLFAARLQGDIAEIVATEAFRAWQLRGYPSTFLPVFVNLVDNALHWLPSSSDPERRITLDVDGEDVTVTDTGPGIPERDRHAVFDLGFTRKTGGRGLGLYISRQVLRRAEWDLRLDKSAAGRGARFRLVPPDSADTAKEETKDA